MDRVQLVRERVSRRFAQRLESEDLGKKLEVVLWNHTLRCCQRDKLPLEWSNDMNVNTFRERYTQKALAIDVHNLKTNDDLRKKIQTGELGLKKFIGMEPWEMNPDMWTPIFDRVAFKALRRQLTVDAENAPDGAFTCAKCNSKKTTYYQLQTRSADVKYAFLIQIQIVSYHFSFVCRAYDGLYPMPQLFKTMEAIGLKEMERGQTIGLPRLGPRCAVGSINYCLTEETAEHPKYIDDHGTKRCCLCHGRGPMYEPDSTGIILALPRWLAPRTP